MGPTNAGRNGVVNVNGVVKNNNNSKSRYRSSPLKKNNKRSIDTRWQRFYDAAYEKEDSRFPSFRDIKGMMEDSGLYFQSACLPITSCFGDENTVHNNGSGLHTECVPDFCV